MNPYASKGAPALPAAFGKPGLARLIEHTWEQRATKKHNQAGLDNLVSFQVLYRICADQKGTPHIASLKTSPPSLEPCYLPSHLFLLLVGLFELWEPSPSFSQACRLSSKPGHFLLSSIIFRLRNLMVGNYIQLRLAC